jgi:hypothetical protein
MRPFESVTKIGSESESKIVSHSFLLRLMIDERLLCEPIIPAKAARKNGARSSGQMR